MKKLIISFIFMLCMANAFAQWTTVKMEGMRYPVYTHMYTVDEGTFRFNTNEDCYNLVISENSLKYDTVDYVSFGYFMSKVYFYNASNIKVGEFDVQLYCNKRNCLYIHSSVNTETSRYVVRYISNEVGFIKFILPGINEPIEFIVLCNPELQK